MSALGWRQNVSYALSARNNRSLNSTLVYARVHDHTLAADFYAAIAQIEQSLKLKAEPPVTNEHESLLALAEQLAEPQLCDERRLELVGQLRTALCWKSADEALARSGEADSA